MISKQILRISSERKRLLLSFASVFFFGILAHGAWFLHCSLSGDSLNEMYLWGDMHYAAMTVAEWKISLGRFINPLYRILFGGITTRPWLAGLLSLVWVSLAVYFIAREFSIDHAVPLCLLGGIAAVNVTYISQSASYINDLDANMFAVLLAVLAFCLWRRGGKRSLWAVPLIALSLGIYQAEVSVTIALIMLSCMVRLWEKEPVRDVFTDGLKAIGLLILGGALYYGLVRAACAVFHVTMDSGYNGLTNLAALGSVSIPHALRLTYSYWLESILDRPHVLPLVVTVGSHVLLALAVLALLPGYLRRKKLSAGSIGLVLALLALLPLGMNLAYFLNSASLGGHDLMTYAFWYVYLLDYLVLRTCAKEMPGAKLPRLSAVVTVALTVLILCGEIGTAHAAYDKKAAEGEQTLSLMTALTERLDEIDGYVPGETPVALIGIPNTDVTVRGRVDTITGLIHKSPIWSPLYYDAYFENILQTPIDLCDASAVQDPAVAVMPTFPATDSVRWIDGVLVVKIG